MEHINQLLIILFIPCTYCSRYNKKKDNLRKGGYIVDKPLECYLYPHRYSINRKHIWDVTTYTKYGKTYTYDELFNNSNKI